MGRKESNPTNKHLDGNNILFMLPTAYLEMFHGSLLLVEWLYCFSVTFSLNLQISMNVREILVLVSMEVHV